MDLSLPAIFGAGLLTFASPCVLPLMPVYLATIAGGAIGGAPRARTLLLASSFTAGLSLVFVLLGALASTLGAVLVSYRLELTLVSAALMLLFGLRGLGLLRIRALDVEARPALHRIGAVTSAAGAFAFGAAFALGWSPCIGPVLASVLTYAATQADTPWRGALYLAIYAAGLSVPLLLLAALAARASALIGRSRRAIPLLEKVTGGALIGVALYTLLSLRAEPLEATIADAPLADTANVACALEGDSDTSHLCALPAAPSAADPVQQVRPDVVDGAHMLEFTSQECPVCRRMRPVLDRLASACSELEQRIVKVDVTTARGRALAARHGIRGTPTFVLFDEAGSEVTRLLGERSKEEVALAVERAFGLSCWG